MLRPLRLALAALLAMVATGCATMMVSSHVQRDVDFARYRSFDWGLADALPTGDPRLDGDPFFNDHMMGAVERGLAERGLRLSPAGAPDLLIHYHANVVQRADVNRVDQTLGYCYSEDCSVRVMEYEAGTIVLDIVDRATNRVVWRGWAQGNFDNVIGDRDHMERMINEAVGKMLERLPRSL